MKVVSASLAGRTRMASISERLGHMNNYETCDENVAVASSFETKRDPKISYLSLSGVTHCILSHIESPSILWIQIPNHVTDTLVEKDMLSEREQGLSKNDYVLAPILTDDGVKFRRAKVVHIRQANGKPYCLVQYFDVGSRNWLSEECCYKFPAKLAHHPKQALCCSLRGLSPSVGEKWSDETTRALNSATKGKKLKANIFSGQQTEKRGKAVIDLLFSDEDENFANVALFVQLVNPQLFRYNKHCKYEEQKIFEASEPAFEKRPPTNAEEWQCIPSGGVSGAPQMIVSGSGYRMPRQEVWVGANATPTVELKGVAIPELQFDDLQLSLEGYLNFSVEDCTSSPDEFWIHPLESGDISAIQDFEDKMEDFKNELDRFYGQPLKRRPLELHRIIALDDGHPVYAIAQCRDENKANYTGTWQRVQLLGSDYVDAHSRARFAGVSNRYTLEEINQEGPGILIKFRYIDGGGNDSRPATDLYELDEQFAQHKRLAVPCRLHSVQPASTKGGFATDGDWSVAAKQRFQRLMRTDIPLKGLALFELSAPIRNPTLRIKPKECPGVLDFISIETEENGEPVLIENILQRDGHASAKDVW